MTFFPELTAWQVSFSGHEQHYKPSSQAWTATFKLIKVQCSQGIRGCSVMVLYGATLKQSKQRGEMVSCRYKSELWLLPLPHKWVGSYRSAPAGRQVAGLSRHVNAPQRGAAMGNGMNKVSKHVSLTLWQRLEICNHERRSVHFSVTAHISRPLSLDSILPARWQCPGIRCKSKHCTGNYNYNYNC
jgi:hypothetical protein